MYVVAHLLYNIYKMSEKRYLLESRNRREDDREHYDKFKAELLGSVDARLADLQNQLAASGYFDRRTRSASQQRRHTTDAEESAVEE